MRPLKKSRVPVQQYQTQYYQFRGGLNEVDPPISVSTSMLRACENYEVGLRGGYRRLDGYERYDGRPRPSSASYWIVSFDAGSTAISEGDLVGDDGASPTIQGEALVDAVVQSGSFGGADAAGYLVLGLVAGQGSPAGFQNNDTLYVGAGAVATASANASERAAATDALDTTYYRDAIETLRADIQVVPGSGPVRGVYLFNGNVYAFRDNAGATAGVMHVASSSGWTVVDLGASIAFTSGGTTAIVVGNRVRGASSSAEATVTRIVLTSGTWAGGDAAGVLWLRDQAGTFVAENLDVVSGGTNLATVAGNSTATTLSAGGVYRFDQDNIEGASLGRRMFGCNGLDAGFQFDGLAFLPIATGMAADTPIFVKTHKNHLFFGFPGGSLQHSSIADPFAWSVVTGAGELNVGAELTGITDLPGGVLGIFTRKATFILYGASSSEWSLDLWSDTTGAIEHSVQRMSNAVYADDRGLTGLLQTQDFGNFKDSVFSQVVDPTFQRNKALVSASCVVREKNQYRIFFSNAAALYVTFDDRRVSGIMPVLLDDEVTCITSEEDGTGVEAIYFGSDDGFVYQMDKGTNFDGGPVIAYMAPVFNHIGSPDIRKMFRKLSLEMQVSGEASLQLASLFSYDDGESPPAIVQSLSVRGGGGVWDAADWDDFDWSDPPVPRAEARIDGSGDNLGVVILHEATYENPHTISGAVVHYQARRRRR